MNTHRETDVLSVLREALTSETPLARVLSLVEPTTTLARMLAGGGRATIETVSTDMPAGLSAYSTKERPCWQAQGGHHAAVSLS